MREFAAHKLTIIHVFKGKEAIFNLLNGNDQGNEIFPDLKYASVEVITPMRESECAVALNYTESYLMFGQTKNDHMEINMCNFISKWNEVTPQIKRGIHGDYDCRCNVETKMTSYGAEEKTGATYDGDIMDHVSSTCYWNMHPDEPVDECALNFLSCRKLVNPIIVDNFAEGCVWVEGEEYEHCKQLQ